MATYIKSEDNLTAGIDGESENGSNHKLYCKFNIEGIQ
jgi:hypothetical protein